MFEKETLEFYHKNRNQIEDAIDQVVTFYGRVDNKFYEINNVRSVYGGFNVEVSNYIHGYGDEYSDKFIPLSILCDQDQYDSLQSQAEEAEVQREQILKQKSEADIKNKLEEAKKFIQQYSNI